MPTGIVLIAHGSRRAEANAELLEVAEGLRGRGPWVVVPAYLELAEPGMIAGGEQCVAAGCDPVVMLPYFLSAGRHVVTDLERARAELARRHPTRTFRLAAPLGPHLLLEEVLVERFHAALANGGSVV